MPLTLVQLSAMSVPVVSAVYPPKDGMTLPPDAWIAAMSAPKLAAEIGVLVSPSQYAVHEPACAVCRKARERNLDPDWRASAAGPAAVSYISKYGAKTWCGRGREPGRVPALAPAAVNPSVTTAADAASRMVNERAFRLIRGSLG